MIGTFLGAAALTGGRGGLMGIGAIGGIGFAASKAFNVLNNGMSVGGTPIINPFNFPRAGASTAYGKRGIDANNLNTQNLTQQLYQNRRKF
jgi:hypothetical protein